MSDNIRGAAPPAPKSTMEIRRVLTSEAHQYVCLSKSIFGQMIHWYGNRSHECSADSKICEGCKRAWPSKWLGYLHVYSAQSSEQCFLEITNMAWFLIDKQLPKGFNLRGMMFRIRKTKGGPKGRFVVEVLERRIEEESLPEEKDPHKVLKYLWSCKRPARQEIG